MESDIKSLLGCTLKSIYGEVQYDTIEFYINDGRTLQMYHSQDCCERVYVSEIIGDLNDLVGAPILLAEETIEGGSTEYNDSCTWTFYKLSTIKGSVTIRWNGESNGCYSEAVDIRIY